MRTWRRTTVAMAERQAASSPTSKAMVEHFAEGFA
jgi:hypothetical protein